LVELNIATRPPQAQSHKMRARLSRVIDCECGLALIYTSQL